jgi:Transposase DDE domain
METVAQVSAALTAVLTTAAESAAWATGLVRRSSRLTGPRFVQALVFGWLRQPAATWSDLACTAAQVGAPVSPQALYQRVGEPAARCLQRVLGAAAHAVVRADPVAVPLLARFAAVYVQDSTTIALPDGLAAAWAGCGGRTPQGTAAALKLQVRWELRRGTLSGPELHPGRASDHVGTLVDEPGPPGSLHLNDLGYFAVERLRAWSAAQVYWLTRLKGGTRVVDATGQDCTRPAYLRAQGLTPLDCAVQVGTDAPLAARLLAVRVPPAVAAERRRKLRAEARREGETPNATRLAWADWTLLLTNVPAALLSVAEALVLVRVRWQIELLFKLWKAQRRLAQWHSTQPWHVLCELYAKLLGLVVQHWLLLVGCWQWPERSLVRAARALRDQLGILLGALRGAWPLAQAVQEVVVGLSTCRRTACRQRPQTYQLVHDPTLPLPFRPRPPARRGRKPSTTKRKVA